MASPSRVLIIGGRSKIADHLIRALLPLKIDITVTVRRNWDPEHSGAIRIVPFSVGHAPDIPIENWMEDFDAVFFIPPISLLPPLIPTLKHFGVKRLICISSHNAILRPSDPTYIQIRAAESEIMGHDIPSYILRPTMIVGHTQHNIGRLIDFAQKWGWLPLPGNGKALQNPIDYRDLAHALAYTYTHTEISPACISLGGPDIVTLKTVYETVIRHTKRHSRIIPVPLWVLKSAAIAAHSLHLPFPINRTQLQHIKDDKHVENTELLGWEAQINLDIMIRDMIENAPSPLT